MQLDELLRRELKKEEKEKKTISLVLEAAKLEAIDKIITGFNILNPEKTFTRQKLVEIAIDNLIDESNKILGEHDLLETSIDNIEVEEEKVYDTAIFPAKVEGFNEVFLGEDQWHYVRLQQDKVEHIKYVACYVGKPVSAITHFAKVKSIEPITVDGKSKYIIKFEDKAKKLENPVVLGKISSAAVRANRYVMLNQLLEAKEYGDLM